VSVSESRETVTQITADARVEILTKLVKNLSPEELAYKIATFDQGVCTQLFLSELKPILPTPEQVCTPFDKFTVSNTTVRLANSIPIVKLLQNNWQNSTLLIG